MVNDTTGGLSNGGWHTLFDMIKNLLWEMMLTYIALKQK